MARRRGAPRGRGRGREPAREERRRRGGRREEEEEERAAEEEEEEELKVSRSRLSPLALALCNGRDRG